MGCIAKTRALGCHHLRDQIAPLRPGAGRTLADRPTALRCSMWRRASIASLKQSSSMTANVLADRQPGRDGGVRLGCVALQPRKRAISALSGLVGTAGLTPASACGAMWTLSPNRAPAFPQICLAAIYQNDHV